MIRKDVCATFFGSEYLSCETRGDWIIAVTVRKGREKVRIIADYFLDCSGSIVLARDAGCSYALGDDNGELTGINGVSFVFRVSRKTGNAPIETEPDALPDDTWVRNNMRHTVSCFKLYPNGDINVNMLPTMTGKEWLEFGQQAVRIGKARVLAYWKYVQERYALGEYKIVKLFEPGIREDYRLVGRKVLTLEDVLSPYSETDRYAAIADHPMDLHGCEEYGTGELQHPYGIPLDCTRPKEYDNLFVACRGASFSHAAASSARLTRTMISLGEGVARHLLSLIKEK